EGHFWLPYRQEIEIRRRVSWLDFPVRGIIRGRWEIGDYELDAPVPPPVLAGPDIAGLDHARGDDGTWPAPLEQAIAAESVPIEQQDMAGVRVEVSRLAGAHLLSGIEGARLATGSVSDLVHVNRVEGLTLGLGGAIHLGAGGVRLRPTVAFGTS